MTKMLRLTPERYAELQALRGQMKSNIDRLKQKSVKWTNRPKPVDQIANAPKYRNQKVEIDGKRFDSKKEAKRWKELVLLLGMGEIKDLQTQVKFTLIPRQKRADGTNERECGYVADFTYEEAGSLVVEDCKGMRTPLYIVKRKLMLWLNGITIKEV